MFLFRPSKRVTLIHILFLSIVMAGCGSSSESYVFTGGGGNPNPNPNPNPAGLTAFTNPVDGATGVALNSRVTVTFSEGIDAASINGTTFTLVDPDGDQGTPLCPPLAPQRL